MDQHMHASETNTHLSCRKANAGNSTQARIPCNTLYKNTPRLMQQPHRRMASPTLHRQHRTKGKTFSGSDETPGRTGQQPGQAATALLDAST